jgi:hypothetical protein
MMSDRTAILQHGERVFADIAGDSRAGTGDREHPRNEER